MQQLIESYKATLKRMEERADELKKTDERDAFRFGTGQADGAQRHNHPGSVGAGKDSG